MQNKFAEILNCFFQWTVFTFIKEINQIKNNSMTIYSLDHKIKQKWYDDYQMHYILRHHWGY